jgi:hypothetical protein
MYRVPASLDLTNLIGSGLSHIQLGRHQVQFHFESGTVIRVQSRISILRGGSIICAWEETSGWTNASFQDLLAGPVSGFSIPNDRLIEILFPGDLCMHLHDDSDQYESMQISRGDEADMVVI